jgi:TPR repeat protein
MRHITLRCLIVLVGTLSALPSQGQTASAPEHACDRLAQPPRQSFGRLPAFAEGVSFTAMRAGLAREACAEAMAEMPGEVRFVVYAARAADRDGDSAEAVRLYRQAADLGDPLAQNNLGAMYAAGEGGLKRSDREAAELYRLAAEQGLPAAQANLAVFYRRGGAGIRRDEREAVRLWALAADEGDAGAQNNLATMYAEGRGGLARDMDEARRLWKAAADQGNEEARRNLRRAGRRN